MTLSVWTLLSAGVGAAAALVLQTRALQAPPAWSLRTNVSGKEVPAVLGGAVFFGSACALLVAKIAEIAGLKDSKTPLEEPAFVVLVLLAAAGVWDDMRGDEAARGFSGHLRAGRLTGGIVKILAGGAAGVVSAALLYRYHQDVTTAVLTALAVPLSANLFNLLDRAPGRTGKSALVVALPLLVFGHGGWALVAAGTFGALAAVLPADLRERGMLGDSGANPIGGMIGLGLAVSLGRGALAGAVLALLALNLASERWSFSKAIERTPFLRALDSLGRDRP